MIYDLERSLAFSFVKAVYECEPGVWKHCAFCGILRGKTFVTPAHIHSTNID